MATNERRGQTRPTRQIANRFLRWTWTRAALARGWWLATSVYLVVVADLSPLELVLLGSFQGITVVAAEVPTGVLADTVSRKWSLVLAHVVMGTGMALTGVVTAFPALVFTHVLWGLGWALSDGADVAWVTDELDRPDLIDRVLTSRGRRDLWGSATGLIAFGGFAWAASLATAMVTGGLAMISLGLVEVARFPERGFVPKRERRIAEAMAILKGGAALARHDRQILVVLVATLLVNGALEVFGRLHPRRLLDLDFPQSPDPIVWFTVLALVALALGIAALHLVEARIDGTHAARRTYALVCLIGMAGLLLLATARDIRTAIAGVLLVSGITSPVARTVSTIWVNRRATGELRATMHSFLAQAENIGEVLLGATLGIVAGAAGIPIALITAASLVAGTCLLVAVAAREHQNQRLPRPHRHTTASRRHRR